MARLEICIYDDPVLREKARPVEKITQEHKKLVQDMAETMYAARGIGLAANQVGRTERVIVVDVEWGKSDDESRAVRRPIPMINPEILEEGNEVDSYDEGCLSLPEIEGEVWRPKHIRVRYLDLAGVPVEVDADGMFARCIQHEIDHLNGVLFIDHLDADQRQKLAGRLARLRKTRSHQKAAG